MKKVKTDPTISHLVAVSNNSVIGVDNHLPWTLKADLKHLSAYTQKKAIIMGKNTFAAIGRALPNRKNIVISSKMKSLEDVQVVSSLKDALNFAESWNIQNNLKNEIVILGGGEVFNQTTNIVNITVTYVLSQLPENQNQSELVAVVSCLPSIEIFGIHSSHLGRYHACLPSIRMTLGTSTDRTTVASRRTAAPRPNPID